MSALGTTRIRTGALMRGVTPRATSSVDGRPRCRTWLGATHNLARTSGQANRSPRFANGSPALQADRKGNGIQHNGDKGSIFGGITLNGVSVGSPRTQNAQTAD